MHPVPFRQGLPRPARPGFAPVRSGASSKPRKTLFLPWFYSHLQRPVVGNAGPACRIKAGWSAIILALTAGLVGKSDGIRANVPCCVRATVGGRPEEHVQEGPGIVARIIRAAAAIVTTTEVVSDLPVGACIAIQQFFPRVFRRCRIEIPGGKCRAAARQSGAQRVQRLVGRDPHVSWVKRCRKMHGEAGQDGTVRELEVCLKNAARIGYP